MHVSKLLYIKDLWYHISLHLQ